MADEIEKAIIYAFDQSGAVAPELRERALAYLQDLQVRSPRSLLDGPLSPTHDSSVYPNHRRPAERDALLPRRRCLNLLNKALYRSRVVTPQAQPDAWKACAERYQATGYPEVRFWCLQTLAAACRTRLPSLSDADAAALKGAGGAQHLSSVSLTLLSRFNCSAASSLKPLPGRRMR